MCGVGRGDRDTAGAGGPGHKGKMAASLWLDSANTYHQPGPNPILSLPQVTSYTGTEERHFQTKVSPILEF